MSAVPVGIAAVSEVRTEHGLLLSGRIHVRPWFASLAERFGASPEQATTKKIELDEMGAFVWSMIDGRRTVQDIADELVARYSVHPREAEIAVTTFLRELGRRGLIGLR